jgi:hypothetical protein
MLEDNFHIAELLVRRLTGNIGEQEQELLETWAKASEANRRQMDDFIDERWLTEKQAVFNDVDLPASWDLIRRRIPELRGLPYRDADGYKPAGTVSKASAVAAIFLAILLAGGGKLYDSLSRLLPRGLVSSVNFGARAARGHTTLRLAGGINILLGDVLSGWLFFHNNTDYYKTDDNELCLVTPNPDDPLPEEGRGALSPPTPDTLVTSDGATAGLRWADGSSVRLNAATALIFPSYFTGLDRDVELLTGESFFDIRQEAPRPTQPAGRSFTVRVRPAVAMKNVFTDTATLTIKAFSTRFNVRAYKEDSSISAALETGSIYIQRRSDIWRLDPGQVYVLSRHGDPAVQGEAFSRLTVPWKEGQFSFNNQPVRQVLSELGRWYNATIVTKGVLTDSLTFEAPRSVPVSDVLRQIAALIDHFHYKISGDTIIVWH